MENSSDVNPLDALRMLDDAILPTSDIFSIINSTSQADATCLMQSQSDSSQVMFYLNIETIQNTKLPALYRQM